MSTTRLCALRRSIPQSWPIRVSHPARAHQLKILLNAPNARSFSREARTLPSSGSRHLSKFRNAFSRRHNSSLQSSNEQGSKLVIWTIIGLNVVVFSVWSYARSTNDRPLLVRMARNFTLSVDNVRDGRWYTALTAAFSHVNLGHIFFNMFTLNTFGMILAQVAPSIVTPLHVIQLCLGSAIAGSAAMLFHSSQRNGSVFDPRMSSRPSLGASGMVMGTAAAATCFVPRLPMSLFFIPIPIPLWAITLSYFVLDTFYLNSNSSIGHAAHLGGGAFGLAYYFLLLRRPTAALRGMRR